MPVITDARSQVASSAPAQPVNPRYPTPVPSAPRSEVIAPPAPPVAAVVFAGGATSNDGQTAGTTTCAVTIPPLVQVGDVALFVMVQNTGVAVFTPPTGWTSLSGPDNTSNVCYSQLWAKQLEPGEPGASVSFTSTVTGRLIGVMAVFSGVDFGGLLDNLSSETSLVSTHTSPTVTTGADGSGIANFWVLQVATAAPSATIALPGTLTADNLARTNFGAAPNLSIQSSHLTAPGAAGSYGGDSGTSSATARSNVYTVALPPTSTGTPAAAAGSIDLGGTVTAQAAPTSAGSVTLGGTATATAAATTSGTITLTGAPTARAAASVSGTVTLGGTATAQARATAAGSITLGGTAAATVAASTAGTVTLSGAPTATAPATTAGTLTLSGAPTAQALATAAGTITLSGTATVGDLPSPATATGAIVLSGAPVAAAPAVGGGVIVLGGAVTTAVAASVAGLITLTGLATAQAATSLRHTLTVGPGRSRSLTAAGTSRTLTAAGVRTRTLTAVGRGRQLAAVGASRSMTATPED